VDEATWAALVAALTIVGGIWTVLAWRRRGAANGLRALGLTLLPAAAWLTGTLEMFTEIALSVTDWATGLAFTPLTWAGLGLAGTSALLLLVSGWVRDRQLARGRQVAQGRTELDTGSPSTSGPALTSRQERGRTQDHEQHASAQDDEIEEILRRRGIT
jgi:hypothetical protein